jgi:hypothetical protein
MSISRKMFNGRITIPGDQAVSLISVMQSSPLHWGLEADLVSPSLDSIIGSECGIVPDSDIWIGSDANVKNTTSGSFYQGVHVAGGANYSLQDFGHYGIIDVNQLYLYSISGGGADLTFTAR